MVFWAPFQSCAACQMQLTDRRLPWWMLKHQTWCSLRRLEADTCIFSQIHTLTVQLKLKSVLYLCFVPPSPSPQQFWSLPSYHFLSLFFKCCLLVLYLLHFFNSRTMSPSRIDFTSFCPITLKSSPLLLFSRVIFSSSLFFSGLLSGSLQVFALLPMIRTVHSKLNLQKPNAVLMCAHF